ncbi:MAG: ABC transporter substrate-binding protein [Pseudobdellovibrionaceae bacterium]
MRVVSLVPSWTETLIECGITVVGRTRFCIHPEAVVTKIPAIGGTKNVHADLIKKLQPNVVLFDREENPKEVYESLKLLLPDTVFIDTHVTSFQSSLKELERLSIIFQSASMKELSSEGKILFEKLKKKDFPQETVPFQVSALDGQLKDFSKVRYVIWKNPWMCVSAETFIGSLLKLLGIPLVPENSENRYPAFDLEAEKESFFYLFSSEPFPFHQEKQKPQNCFGAVVDGEAYSWFGYRSIKLWTKFINGQ